MGRLPDLRTRRRAHACGHYLHNGEAVFIVAGGWDIRNQLSSTEVLRAGSSRWRTGGALPSARRRLRGVTILNQFYVTGGYDGSVNTLSDVLRYNPESEEWTSTGHLATPRYYHAVSTVDIASVAAFCSPEESGTRMSPNNSVNYNNNNDEERTDLDN